MSFGLSMIERETPLKPWMENYDFVLVQSVEHLADIVEKAIAAPYCAFDLESTGLDTRLFTSGPMCQVVGYSLAFEEKTCYYIPIRHKVETSRGKNMPIKETNALINKLLQKAIIVGHNWLKFDAEMMLSSDGINIRKFKAGEEITYHDSYVLGRLAGYKPAGLKHLSKSLLGKEMIEIGEVVADSRDIDFASVSPYEALIYAASDAICTKEVFEHPTIQAPITEQKFIYNLERKVLYVVRSLERNKMKLNVEFCKELDAELVGKISQCTKVAYRLVSEKTEGKIKEFKLDSPADVADIFFNIFDMNPKPEKGKNGQYTTDDATLEKLAAEYELAKVLQEYRTHTKFHRTYIKNMINNVDKDGYLKFQFSSLQTDTGRFASPGGGKKGDGCSGVNIQACPARYDKSKPNIRKCLSGDSDEVIVAMDWAGVELRVAANMSLEPIWVDRFLKGDGDLHTSTAAIIYDKQESAVNKEERQTGKCVDPHSLMFINGEYQRIGNLHTGRDIDKFYDVTNKNYEVKISKTENSKIKNFYSNGPAEQYLVVSRRGAVVSSAKHRFELEDKKLVKAIDLKKGDVLDEVEYGLTSLKPVDEIYFNPFLKTQSTNNTFTIKINTDLAYILGLFTGDGSSSKNACCIHTGGHGKYLEWADSVKESLEKIGLDVRLNKIQTTKMGHMNRKLYFGSRHTIQVFQQLEVINEDFKKSLVVPDFILNAREEVKLAFIGGLIDTDGTVGKKGSIDFTTKSWKLAQDMCVLLASLDMHYSLEANYNKTYNKYYFRVRISKLNNSKIRPYIKCPWKLERVSDPVFNYTKFPKNTVTHVIPIGVAELVDIEVEHESHMYLVNNLRTHNTFNFQSVYGGGPGALASTIGITVDDAKEKQQRFFGRLQTLRNFIKSLQKTAQKNHYSLTKFGRKALLPEYTSEFPKVRAGADRQAVNYPIQGCLYGEARVLIRDKGFVQIKDYANSTGIEVWEGTKWVQADCVFSGKKQKVIVEFINGLKIICSPEHKFLTVNTRGNQHWKKCTEFAKQEHVLLTGEVSDFNNRYLLPEDSEKTAHNKKFVSLNTIENDFDLGFILGRFASDGSLDSRNDGKSVSWFVAEHEYSILPRMRSILEKIGHFSERKITNYGDDSKPRVQEMTELIFYSKTLAKQFLALNLKISIHDFVWSSKDILRGFLSGMYDGDGGISAESPVLTFGKGDQKAAYASEIQKALHIFGIQSRASIYSSCSRVRVKMSSNEDFYNKIGFANEIKQKKLAECFRPKEQGLMGKVEEVRTVTVTDDFIDMYDIVNCPDQKYMADGLIVHNTAADLMKLAMVKIDEYLDEHNLHDYIKMVITMHDELCFRIKKSHIDLIPEIEHVMKLGSVLDKIGWKVPLAVDVEIGDSWDVNYEYSDMQGYLMDFMGTDKVGIIYEPGQDFESHLKGCSEWRDAKKKAKAEKEEGKQAVSMSDKSRDDFKKMGDSVVTKAQEPKKVDLVVETKIEPVKKIPSIPVLIIEPLIIREDTIVMESKEEAVKSYGDAPASASDLDNAFKILSSAALSDLPMEAHQKLKKAFYEQEIERILSGTASSEDDGIELPIVVHNPIDEMKKSYMGVILDTCRGKGKIKFVNSDRQELHEGWFDVDVLKASVMAKIFNL